MSRICPEKVAKLGPHGTLPGMVRTGATFADAAAEFLRYVEFDRALKPSTLRGYRSIIDAYLLPAFGSRRLEDITTREVELWRSKLTSVGGGGRKPKQQDKERQEWMGHADIQTTMRYLHYAPRAEDAQLVAEAGEAPARWRGAPGVVSRTLDPAANEDGFNPTNCPLTAPPDRHLRRAGKMTFDRPIGTPAFLSRQVCPLDYRQNRLARAVSSPFNQFVWVVA